MNCDFENEITRYIPSFAGFTEFTTSIPKLYWGVKSQEQRILALCKLLNKVICYADMLGEETNEIRKMLQDILDGKLDPMIEAAIAEWFKEHQGEILADIEELKQELASLRQYVDEQDAAIRTEFDGRIDALEADIEELKNSEMRIYVMNSEYAATLVQADGKNIVFDCGSSAETERIEAFFTKHSVTRLDAVVITHFHGDHWSGFEKICDYCDGETDIFVQMPAPRTNYDYSAYELGHDTVFQLCETNGLKTPVVPLEGRTFEYDDVKLTMWNTDVTNVIAYEDAWANSSNALTEKHSSLNNYSLISRVQYLGNVYVDTGDIEGAAQQIYKDKIGMATVAKNPHHFDNRMGVFEFYQQLSPKIWFSTNNLKPATDTEVEQYAYMQGYLARYLVWMEDNTPYLGNVGVDVEIELAHGEPLEFTGYRCSIYNYVESEPRLDRMHWTMSLPPEYYNEYPFALRYQLTLEDFADEINDYAKMHSPYIFGIGYDASVPLAVNMYAVFPNYPTSGYGINFTLGLNELKLEYMYPYYEEPIAIIQPAYTLDDPLKRVIRTGNGSYGMEIDIEGNTIPSEDMTFLQTAKILDVTLSNNVHIPVVKRVSAISQLQPRNWSGTVLNDNGTAIYMCNITNNTITSKVVTIASGVSSNTTVTKIAVVA